jgi:hypothetical protein
MNWQELVSPVIGLLATGVGAWIAHRFTQPRDHERAVLLTRIAEDAAAVIVAFNPRATWPDLLRDLVQRISTAAGVPTRNLTAIENAATAALMKLGKAPGV